MLAGYCCWMMDWQQWGLGLGARENQDWAGRSQEINHRKVKTQVDMGGP